MADIFISYAREDQVRVESLVAALEQQGWSVFWDRRIPSGQTWRSYIGNALDQARCVIVVWSRDSVASTWVMEEADDGKRRGVLVPVLVDPVEQPRGFREIQTADLTAWEPGHPSPRLDELLRDIATLLRGAPTSAGTRPAQAATPAAAGPGVPRAQPKPPANRLVIAAAVLAGGLAIATGAFLAFQDTPSPPTPTPRSAPETRPIPPAAQQQAVETTPAPPPAAPIPPEPERPAPAAKAAFGLRAVIDDPDGYTNVRRQKSASSQTVARVLAGEEFATHVQEGNWWLVRTQAGVSGYMHVSRIRILRQE